MQKTDLIKSYRLVSELDEAVASLLIEDFQKEGLVLLPAGNTFEKGIYPLVNDYFSIEGFKTLSTDEQRDVFNHQQRKVHDNLRLSHLDELCDEGKENTFSSQIKASMSEVFKQVGENFYPINIKSAKDFELYLSQGGGPRKIYFGLGADPANAHVAFIGEEFINSTVTRINLSESASDVLECKEALTIGTDVFDSTNLERIVVVAKGSNKAESLKASFSDSETGLGFLIENYSNKLEIHADFEAMDLLK